MNGSVWAATLPDGERVGGEPLDGDARADVTIVGAGYTGLWTAYYLAVADPTLHVKVVDAAGVGFGASGRNGGWCSGLLPLSLPALSARHGRYAAMALQRAMNDSVGEMLAVAATEGIDAGAAHGGVVTLARNAAQEARLRTELSDARRFGFEDCDLRWLGDDEAATMCRATGVRAGLFSPHCAAVHPLRLVHGLAAAAVRRSVRIYTDTPVVAVGPERVDTAGGRITTEVVVIATEAFTARLPGRRRDVLPVYSLMVATEPLADEVWSAIGLDGRPTFTDARHGVIYGQRTADGRLAFGGRGAPYHARSRIESRFDTDERVRRDLVATARALFPVLGDVEFPYHWGGPLGVARDWHPSVRFDHTSRLALAGGYAGDGVAAAHLAGATLADLITGQATARTELPWVHHHSPAWETEPWRWLGVNAARVAAGRADRAEASSGPLARRRAAGWRRVLHAVAKR